VYDKGWRRPIRCLKLQVIFHKRAISYRALLWKMTYNHKASYGFSPPCMNKTCHESFTREWFHLLVITNYRDGRDVRGSAQPRRATGGNPFYIFIHTNMHNYLNIYEYFNVYIYIYMYTYCIWYEILKLEEMSEAVPNHIVLPPEMFSTYSYIQTYIRM